MTMATKLSQVAIDPVNEFFRTLTAFSQGDLVFWAKAGTAETSSTHATPPSSRRCACPGEDVPLAALVKWPSSSAQAASFFSGDEGPVLRLARTITLAVPPKW